MPTWPNHCLDLRVTLPYTQGQDNIAFLKWNVKYLNKHNANWAETDRSTDMKYSHSDFILLTSCTSSDMTIGSRPALIVLTRHSLIHRIRSDRWRSVHADLCNVYLCLVCCFKAENRYPINYHNSDHMLRNHTRNVDRLLYQEMWYPFLPFRGDPPHIRWCKICQFLPFPFPMLRDSWYFG